ncbi:MAG: hypothetical protein J6L05_01485 [Ruminococcus sp.]|nr:hypothetical protein [Ruminococcus sp.]
MGILSIFKGGNYFDKAIQPKCDYCQFGKRAKDGNKVLCEKKGLVESNYSCGKFTYSPLKRIPVKQLNFVGSLADEDIYSESAGDRAEKQAEINSENSGKKDAPKQTAEKVKDEAEKVKADDEKSPVSEETAAPEETPASEENTASEESSVSEG